MLDIIKVIILGIVEGITEWLPVSSTGHLILVGNVLKPGMSDAFMEMFDVVIQLGAIMAVVILFWDKLWPFTVTSNKKVAVQKDKIILWVKIVFACIPAAIVGALLLGVSRSVASEFTFCLAVPVMFGASFLKVIKHGFHFTGMEVMIILAGMITAFIVSMIVIKMFMKYVKGHNFNVFGWYRIVLGICVLFLGMTGIITV